MSRILILCSLFVFSTVLEGFAGEEGYARPQLLVEPADLAKPDSSGRRVVLDGRERKKFEEQHVPGARWVDAATWAKAFGDGKDIAAWSRRIGDLGIRADSTVVVYDDSMSRDAARIWWILRYWGIDDARLLNGGWTGWKSGRLPVEAGSPKAPPPVDLTLKPRAERLATKDLVLETVKDHKFQIVDTRSEAEYCGREKHAKRAGAIPGATHLEWIDVIEAKTQRFKGAADLRKVLRDAGVDPDRPAITHCQSGARASVMVFAMELLGAKDVRNYYASWGEWGNADDTPIVTETSKASKK